MERTAERDFNVVADDGARHADTLDHKNRMPVFDRNKLLACEDVEVTPEHKRRALELMQVD